MFSHQPRLQRSASVESSRAARARLMEGREQRIEHRASSFGSSQTVLELLSDMRQTRGHQLGHAPTIYQGHWGRAGAAARGRSPVPTGGMPPRQKRQAPFALPPRPSSSPGPAKHSPALAAAMRALAARGGEPPDIPLAGPRHRPFIPRLDLSRVRRHY